MTVNDILLSVPDQQQWRARYGISARQQQDAPSEGNLRYQPCVEVPRRGSLRFGVIMPSLARGDDRGKPWKEYNQKRGGHDG